MNDKNIINSTAKYIFFENLLVCIWLSLFVPV